MKAVLSWIVMISLGLFLLDFIVLFLTYFGAVWSYSLVVFAISATLYYFLNEKKWS